MNEKACCDSPRRDCEPRDLGHVGSFEFVLVRCRHCGSYWMNAFCTATNTTGFEAVSEADAQIMLNKPSGPELKAFVYKWFREQDE